MAQRDPLENIMGMLQTKSSINPEVVSERKGRMKEQRMQSGAEPRAARTQRPDAGRPIADKPSPEEGMVGDMTAPETTMPIIIDALNESIIALKVEIHRTADPKEREKLENQTAKLRQQILELGGEPIRAEETIEQGLQKLTGHGYVAKDAIQGLAGQSLKDVGHYLGISVGADGGRAQVGGQSFDFGTIPGTTFNPEEGRHYVSDPGQFLDTFGSRGDQHTMAQVTHQPGMYATPEAMQRPEDDLSRILQQLGGGHQASAAPAPILNADYVNQLIGEYGLRPRSEQEIAEHARAIVERQKHSQIQLVQREIDRFEREHPPEFARAQRQIEQQAKEISAQNQEEFANRGMFYSSVMANNLGAIDAATMDIIADIANQSASYVLGLHEDIRDIEQWAILEEEVLRRQMEAEERDRAMVLMQIQVQVAQHADQFALDSWYRQEQLALAQRDQALQEIQMKINEAERAGQHLASAYLADTPLIQQEMRKLGISPEQFAQMGLEERSYMVNNIATYVEMDQQYRMNEFQMQTIAAEMALKERAQTHVEEYDWARYGLARDQFEFDQWATGENIAQGWASISQGWAQIGISQANAARTASHQAWQRSMAERELELKEAHNTRTISDEAYNVYLQGLGFLKDGHIDAAQGTWRRLGEIEGTTQGEWSALLGRDIYRLKTATEADHSATPEARDSVIRNILDAGPQQPAYPDFRLQDLMPEPRSPEIPDVRRAPGR